MAEEDWSHSCAVSSKKGSSLRKQNDRPWGNGDGNASLEDEKPFHRF
jgi:hypothetical protein